jgi:hypothetical protein
MHQDMIRRWRDLLLPEGVLVIKDVSTRPWWKRWFTYALDRLMVKDVPVCYRSPEEMGQMLSCAGLIWQTHDIKDYLPYPHIIYFSRVKK